MTSANSSAADGRALIDRFLLALDWIRARSQSGAGIAITDVNPLSYPEVSGYFIPSLLLWGERDRARQYADWLVGTQHDDGSWYDPDGQVPYTFDTGQILKGLLACGEAGAEYEHAIRRGCDWIMGQVQPDGRVTTPDTRHWVLPSGRIVPEAIHLYALEPLRIAARKWPTPHYEEAVRRALAYYLANDELTRFDTLSHFHAYIVEALVDLGCPERASAGMEEVARLQSVDGSVPAYADTEWVCSTGIFQYAVIWYRLGERERADRAFAYGCRLQNNTGGFFGSYGRGANYFPLQEISWAIKYFLDALGWKIRTAFDAEAGMFPTEVRPDDGRYRLIADAVRTCRARSVLEAGCGKGRFLRRLRQDFPHLRLSGLDLSARMLASLPEGVDGLRGSLLDIPAADETYDLVYSVEALEHAVNIPAAIRELCRVVSPEGALIVVDKNRARLGQLAVEEWEQWFDADEVNELLQEHMRVVRVQGNVPYDGHDGGDGLFLAWIATKC